MAEGRAFFDSFFSGALERANLDDASLRPSPGAASSSAHALAGNGLDCGSGRPSAAELAAGDALNGAAASEDGDAEEEARRAEAQDQLGQSVASMRDLSLAGIGTQPRVGGPSTALLSRQSSFGGTRTPVMDKDGLGWPGEWRARCSRLADAGRGSRL
jgi:hypothetical protein